VLPRWEERQVFAELRGWAGCCRVERGGRLAGCCREMGRGEAGYCRARRDWPLREMRGRVLPSEEEREGKMLPRGKTRGRVLPREERREERRGGMV